LAHGGESIEAVTTDHEIAFETTAVGEPHWVKTSYFPNWKVEGAEGPYQASPSLMMVIPTEKRVRLYYTRTWPEWTGLTLSIVALFIVATPPIRRRVLRSGEVRASPEPAPRTRGYRCP
jgi:hypothetical protein